MRERDTTLITREWLTYDTLGNFVKSDWYFRPTGETEYHFRKATTEFMEEEGKPVAYQYITLFYETDEIKSSYTAKCFDILRVERSEFRDYIMVDSAQYYDKLGNPMDDTTDYDFSGVVMYPRKRFL